MSNLMSQLENLVRPPENPTRIPTSGVGEWDQIESELGLCFPAEYKEYVERYGQGEFAGLLHIQTPFQTNIKNYWSSLAASYHDWDEEVPYEIFPNIPGLLPFGSYGDSDLLAWFTQGSSNSWPIVFHNHAEGFFATDQSFLTFLLTVLTGSSPFPESNCQILCSESSLGGFIFLHDSVFEGPSFDDECDLLVAS